MNKAQIAYLEKAMGRVKVCALGRIAEDINSRTPPEPEPLTPYEKYLLIRDGKAILNRKLRPSDFRYGSGPNLIDGYSYPETPEEARYREINEALAPEKNDRELACELAFNRLLDEAVFGLITEETFLNRLEEMAQQAW